MITRLTLRISPHLTSTAPDANLANEEKKKEEASGLLGSVIIKGVVGEVSEGEGRAGSS